MELNGAKIIIECLLEQGVDTIFGYPGGNVLDLYDALYDYQDKIKHIITAHEQGACHAADGYARVSQKTGVVFATSGPGATNLVTGIANAYMDSSPIVAITGNVPLALLGRDSFQEVDITGITMPITKHNYIVKDIKDLADIMRQAFYLANSGRKGPVLVDIPKNIFTQTDEFARAAPKENKNIWKGENMTEAMQLIKKSKKPLIFIGGGVTAGNAQQEILKLSETLDAPVCCSLMGISSFDCSHPNYLGLLGMHGHVQSNMACKECDLIIAVGTRFSDRVATNRDSFSRHKDILHIDIDNAEIDKNITSTTHLLGNCKYILQDILKNISKVKNDEWQKRISLLKSQEKPLIIESEVNPRDVLLSIAKHSPPDQVIVTDVGQHQMWTAQYYPFKKPRTFVTSGGLGTMGFGMGAAIGASVFSKKKVFLITGDGSFHMNMNEFATCVKNNLPIVAVVMNNHVLGMVRQLQKLFYKGHYSQTSINHATNYKMLAEAFGGVGMEITKSDQIHNVIKKAVECKKPVIINVELASDQGTFPMIPSGKDVDDIIMGAKEDTK